MDQKNCVGNILFFKNVWRGPLCSRRAGSLVIKLLTRVLGRYNVKSVNRIKQNRDLNQCFLHPVHCHNCRAVNCFFQTLKILLWTCEDQIGADTIFQRSVFIACSFKKKNMTKQALVVQIPHFLTCRAIESRGVSVTWDLLFTAVQEAGRGPQEKWRALRVLLRSSCPWQQQWAVTSYVGSSF